MVDALGLSGADGLNEGSTLSVNGIGGGGGAVVPRNGILMFSLVPMLGESGSDDNVALALVHHIDHIAVVLFDFGTHQQYIFDNGRHRVSKTCLLGILHRRMLLLYDLSTHELNNRYMCDRHGQSVVETHEEYNTMIQLY